MASVQVGGAVALVEHAAGSLSSADVEPGDGWS
jgi:hypothetical protein